MRDTSAVSTQGLLARAFTAFQAGRNEDAAAACREVLKSAPKTADAHHLLGIIAHRSGKPDDAARHVRRAIEASPGQAEFHNTLGAIERAAGRTDAAISSFRRALELAPQHAQAMVNLGNALAADRQFEAAAESYRRALTVAPDAASIHNNLGNVLRELADLDGAITSYEAALGLAPNYVEARSNLGVALVGAERYGEAVAAYQQALALDPNHLPALANIGQALLVMGEYRGAGIHYKRALELKPDFVEVKGNLVALQNYSDDTTGRRTCLLAKEYGALVPTGEPYRFGNDADPHRRLRVGLVSGDLRNHPVGRFLLPLLSSYDPEVIEFAAYSTARVEDKFTAAMRPHFSLWRGIRGVPAPEAVEIIRGDAVDILIDLAGYTDDARLDIFARRGAPVQAGWLGYSGTTGIPAMDHILADRWVAPEGTEDEFSETVQRLPGTYLCFGQPDWPTPGELPARRKGHLTFGSFNNIAKLGDRTIATWIDVLRAVPGSHLLLKSSKGGVQDRLDQLRDRFTAAGIGSERLRFVDRVADWDAHLALYNEIDVGLDPFPYNGTTTTCEALWMGVPVLTIKGESFVARVGESLMQTIGLPDWIAGDADDYVTRARRLAGDLGSLAAVRAGLRARVASTSLGNPTVFARQFEAALRQMWQRWCDTQR
ncbi:MAG TPA: tetratricopeptide repeat protein [Devosia sp.]